MPGVSDSLESAILDWFMNISSAPLGSGGAYTLPGATLYVSLHFADPEGNGGSELQTVTASANIGYSPGYARLGYSGGWTKLTSGIEQKITNNADVLFANASQNWNQSTTPPNGTAADIPFFGIWKHISSTNPLDFLGSSTLPASTKVLSGQQLKFPGAPAGAGNLSIQIG